MADSLGRVGGDRWAQVGQSYWGECCRDDCKAKNRCQAVNSVDCADYPGAPSYPLAIKPKKGSRTYAY